MAKIKKRGKKISITFDNKCESSNLLRAVGFKNIPALQDEQAVEHSVQRIGGTSATCQECGLSLDDPEHDPYAHTNR